MSKQKSAIEITETSKMTKKMIKRGNKHLSDKSNYHRGEWDNEPENIQYTERGFQCQISRHPEFGILRGYVLVPKPTPSDKDLEDLDVHGGVTHLGESVDGIWVGFDCGHSEDVYPSKMFKSFNYEDGGTYKNIEFVKAEITKMIDQIIEIK